MVKERLSLVTVELEPVGVLRDGRPWYRERHTESDATASVEINKCVPVQLEPEREVWRLRDRLRNRQVFTYAPLQYERLDPAPLEDVVEVLGQFFRSFSSTSALKSSMFDACSWRS